MNLSDTKIVRFDFGDKSVLKRERVSKEMLDADVIISVPAMKTHLMTGVTLGMKNMYGTLPEIDKARYHQIGIDEMLYWINYAFTPNLTVIDGSIGGETVGPLSCDAVDFRTTIASTSVVTADAIAAQMIGFKNPCEEVDHLKLAHERSLGDASQEFDFTELPYKHPSDGNWKRPDPDVARFYTWGTHQILKIPGWDTLFNIGADFFLYDTARLPLLKYFTSAFLQIIHEIAKWSMGAPSKIHTIQLVNIQPEERLATTSELNPSTQVLVTGCCEARGMGYWAATQVKVLSPEIHLVSEVDVFHLTEDNTLITVNPNLRSWNIAGSSGMLRGDASPTGSEAVARYQTDTMGTREGQCVLLTGVCGVKPVNGEALQMACWESDQFIVPSAMLRLRFALPSKQGNACGGKELAEEPLGQGHIFRTQMQVKDGNKTGFITYLINDREGSSEEPDEGKPHVRFCEGVHSNLGAITPAGGAL
uniref:DUF362 domain-containing protein n=1 Tax=Candidatus Methanogaster sp. ANME-2c ERB4 TaxID=2759911 RepID=A0A7G9YGE3_9EURY|nr:hypothetical protein ONOHIMFI_00003 [Methanosarcinales archaeon ANME-2c ERB4]